LISLAKNSLTDECEIAEVTENNPLQKLTELMGCAAKDKLVTVDVKAKLLEKGLDKVVAFIISPCLAFVVHARYTLCACGLTRSQQES
jgi:hypothetical protein